VSEQVEDHALDELIHRADLDGLVRLIDAETSTSDWAGLLRLRDRARAAVSTGRQLWPAATLAEYRLALWAPAEWAARVLDEDSGRFTIGPLTEVAAVHHSFAELADHVPAGPRLGFVAHERALRGEPIHPDAALDVLEIPLDPQPWEPRYVLATYTDEGLTADPPPRPVGGDVVDVATAGIVRVDDADVTLAVRQLLEAWTASSNGRAEVAAVEGSAAEAVAALGVTRPRLTPLDTAEALAWLAWAGSSGGAHGRRRGAAIGRFGAWWLVAALGAALEDWPLPPEEVGELATELRWWWWDAGEPPLGWELQLAVEDPAEGWAWAISAHDAD
jgi:hypothetical protein